MALQVYRQERVFISHAGPQKGFALHLRTQLRDAGVSTFVDERELLPGDGHSAAAVMEAACRQAQLVVFVVTRDFLRRHATVQELRWALDQRQQQQGTAAAGGTSPAAALPHLLTVLYPMSVSPSWRVPELQQLLSDKLQQLAPGVSQGDIAAAAQQLDVATNDATVDVGELQNGGLSGLLQQYHPAAGVAEGGNTAVTAQQAAADLEQLAQATVLRADAVARLAHAMYKLFISAASERRVNAD
jgi:TIR domain